MKGQLLAIPLIALSLGGCTAPPASPSATPQSAARLPAATSTPIFVDDMMGHFPQQTVFVATADRVSAVTLLNHHVRYRIPTNGQARVSADPERGSVYVLDQIPGLPGQHRLRGLSIATGEQRVAQPLTRDRALATAGDDDSVVPTPDGDGATSPPLVPTPEGNPATSPLLALTPDGERANTRVLVLTSDGQRATINAYHAGTLRPLGSPVETPGCGDRLLTSATRVAVVCSATGQLALIHRNGTTVEVAGAPANIVAAAMADNGSLLLATAEPRLAAIKPASSEVQTIPWPADWTGSVIPDGLATVPIAQYVLPAQETATTNAQYALLAQETDASVWLRVFAMDNIIERRSLRLNGVPHGGLLALWPFAYFTVKGSIRHVDLNNGILETMGELGTDAVPVAVVSG